MTYTTGQKIQLTPEGLRIALGKCHDWNLDDPCIIKRICINGNYKVQNNRSKEVFSAFEKK